MLRLIKNVDLFLLKNQFDFIFNDIDLKIRAFDIKRFKNNIILNDFLIEFNDVKHDWWKKNSKHRFDYFNQKLKSNQKQ